MADRNAIPFWVKYTLTIQQASEYFNIGEKKMRQIVQENPTADYILTNGTKILIKRIRFEQYVDDVSSI